MAIEYQCKKCRDLGYTLQEDKEGYTIAVPCECIEKRQIKEKLERFLVKVRHLDLENAPHGFLTNSIDHKYTNMTIEFLKGSDFFG